MLNQFFNFKKIYIIAYPGLQQFFKFANVYLNWLYLFSAVSMRGSLLGLYFESEHISKTVFCVIHKNILASV